MQELLQRNIAPKFQTIKQILLPPASKKTFQNGIEAIFVNTGIQDILKLELSFKNIVSTDYTKATAQFAFKMLTEGTMQYNSHAISEHFDQHGGFIETTQGMDNSSIVVYGLSKYIHQYVFMLNEMLTNSTFPANELQTAKDIAIQNLKLNNEKNSFLASKAIRKLLFHETHPYGFVLEESDIANIKQDELVSYHNTFIKNKPFSLQLSGKINDETLQIIENTFGTTQKYYNNNAVLIDNETKNTITNTLIKRPKALQSSIRLGKKMLTRGHEDYHKILLTNEILGGYFGSRLMKNIREEKGLTYGISSSIVALKEEAYLVIGADVKKEFTQLTIDEIKKEIRILQTQLVPSDELETVKNYLAGAFAGSVNTPFEIMERHKIIANENLSNDFYDQYIPKINSITAEQVKETAIKYFNIDSMVEAIVGDLQ
ncbi:MAG: insulinase family protein [Pseudarcicella sp.]|nr:insulinase family protein [Pseudarcicella sp.]